MDLALSTIALTGVVIFLIAWLLITISAFRHHFITGLISLIPGINLLILPTIWGKSGKVIVTSMLAFVVAAGAWFAGEKNYKLSLDHLPFAHSSESIQEDHPIAVTPPSVIAASANKHDYIPPFLSPKRTKLPNKALYYLLFKEVDRQNWDHLKDSLIRITFEDETRLEGRVANILPDRLIIKYHKNKETQVFETKTSRIVNLEKLIKHPSI